MNCLARRQLYFFQPFYQICFKGAAQGQGDVRGLPAGTSETRRQEEAHQPGVSVVQLFFLRR
jgi:hypothetical protein